MDAEMFLRMAHLIGAAVLFGTGAGIAFFMLMAHRTGDARTIAETARIVIIADFLFTATAVAAQPVTGVLLAWEIGWRMTEGWLLIALGLYVLTGLFWLPVVFMQIRMRDLALAAAFRNEPPPAAYQRLFRRWLVCGIPAFLSVFAIYWLMISRPEIAL